MELQKCLRSPFERRPPERNPRSESDCGFVTLFLPSYILTKFNLTYV